jgi:hypothetical protein
MKRTVAAALVATLALAAAPRAQALDLAAPGVDALRLTLTQSAPAAMQVERTVFGLPKNVGPVDRVLRAAVAATLLGVGAYRLSNDAPNSGLSYALMGVAALPAATSASAYCPAYHLLGIDRSF